MEAYRTVLKEAEAEFVEKRSRFIGCIRPAASEEEALAFFARLKKAHWNASHHVTAYVLREGQVRRYSDDGEPQGTAGMPVLDVLLKAGLADCAVMVIRYFGGTLARNRRPCEGVFPQCFTRGRRGKTGRDAAVRPPDPAL